MDGPGGVGPALLDAAERRMRDGGCQIACLTAAQDAVPFYRAPD
ncbi:GNAT family N-acetyltransferase [Gymnodinialimonas sp. 2305UL16-5]